VPDGPDAERFSIPTTSSARTIYTVVTKPIRASEIVLGRTSVLRPSARSCSWGWESSVISRDARLAHDHQVEMTNLVEVERRRSSPPRERRTTRMHHRTSSSWGRTAKAARARPRDLA
jgi:hypothetical protein